MKKFSLLLLEIIIVLGLIILLASVGIDKYHNLSNDYATYSVRLRDVDGLSVGSPVRFAGLRVGHVIKLELQNNDIIVTFKLTAKKIKLPQGSSIGVEFAGMGGSKSLEIKPPTTTKNKEQFNKIEPIRVNSFMEVQNEIYKETLVFFNGILDFLNKNEKNAKVNIKNAAESIKENTNKLNELQGKIKETTESTAKNAEHIKTIITETNTNIEKIKDNITDSPNINKIQETTKSVSDFMKSGKLDEFSDNVNNFNNQVSKTAKNEVKYINEFNESIKSTSKNLQKFVDSVSKDNKDKKDQKI